MKRRKLRNVTSSSDESSDELPPQRSTHVTRKNSDTGQKKQQTNRSSSLSQQIPPTSPSAFQSTPSPPNDVPSEQQIPKRIARGRKKAQLSSVDLPTTLNPPQADPPLLPTTRGRKAAPPGRNSNSILRDENLISPSTSTRTLCSGSPLSSRPFSGIFEDDNDLSMQKIDPASTSARRSSSTSKSHLNSTLFQSMSRSKPKGSPFQTISSSTINSNAFPVASSPPLTSRLSSFNRSHISASTQPSSYSPPLQSKLPQTCTSTKLDSSSQLPLSTIPDNSASTKQSFTSNKLVENTQISLNTKLPNKLRFSPFLSPPQSPAHPTSFIQDTDSDTTIASNDRNMATISFPTSESTHKTPPKRLSAAKESTDDQFPIFSHQISPDILLKSKRRQNAAISSLSQPPPHSDSTLTSPQLPTQALTAPQFKSNPGLSNQRQSNQGQSIASLPHAHTRSQRNVISTPMMPRLNQPAQLGMKGFQPISNDFTSIDSALKPITTGSTLPNSSSLNISAAPARSPAQFNSSTTSPLKNDSNNAKHAVSNNAVTMDDQDTIAPLQIRNINDIQHQPPAPRIVLQKIAATVESEMKHDTLTENKSKQSQINERGSFAILRDHRSHPPSHPSPTPHSLATTSTRAILTQYRNKNRELALENTNLLSQLKIARREQVVLKRSYESHLSYVRAMTRENETIQGKLDEVSLEKLQFAKAKSKFERKCLQLEAIVRNNGGDVDDMLGAKQNKRKTHFAGKGRKLTTNGLTFSTIGDSSGIEAEFNESDRYTDTDNDDESYQFSPPTPSSSKLFPSSKDYNAVELRVKELANELDSTNYALDTLQVRFDSLTNAHIDLQSLQTATSSQLHAATERVVVRDNDFHTIKRQFVELQGKFDDVTFDLTASNSLITTLRNSLSAKEQRYDALMGRFDELNVQLELNQKNSVSAQQSSQSTIAALEIERKVLSSRYETIYTQSQEKGKQIMDLENEIAELRAEVARLVSQHSSQLLILKAEADVSSDRGVQTFMSTIQELTQERDGLKDKIAKIESQLAKLAEKYAKLDVEYRSVLLDLSSSQIDLATRNSTTGQKTAPFSPTRPSTRSSLNTTMLLDNLDDKFEKTVQKLQEYTGNLRDSHNQYTALQCDHDTLLTKLNLLEESNQEQIVNSKHQLDTMAMANSSLQTVLSQTQQLYEETLSQFKSTLIDKNAIFHQKEQLQKEILSLNESHALVVQNLEAQLSASQLQYNESVARHSDKNDLVDSLREEVSQLNQVITAYEESTIPQFDHITNEWQEYCSQLEDDIQNKIDQLMALENEFVEQEDKYTTVLIKCRELITQLSTRLENSITPSTQHQFFALYQQRVHPNDNPNDNRNNTSDPDSSDDTPDHHDHESRFHSDDEVCIDDFSPTTSSSTSDDKVRLKRTKNTINRIQHRHQHRHQTPTAQPIADRIQHQTPSTTPQPIAFIDLTDQIDDINRSLDHIFFPDSKHLLQQMGHIQHHSDHIENEISASIANTNINSVNSHNNKNNNISNKKNIKNDNIFRNIHRK